MVAWSAAVLAAPAAAQTRTLDAVGFIPGPATTVHVHDSIAYVSDGPTLRLVDVSDPAAPAERGTYTFPQNIYCVRVADHVLVEGDGPRALDSRVLGPLRLDEVRGWWRPVMQAGRSDGG